MPKITVSLNGGEPVPVDSVRVYVEGLPDVDADGDEIADAQLEYNFTHEGVIQELVDGDGIKCGTDSATYEERVENLYLYG